MHKTSIKLKAGCTLALVLNASPLFAAELYDNHAYAILQQCLATAESPANWGSELDRYCIDSYLATTGDDRR